MLRPDVVVAGRFTKLATRQLLKDKGLRVVEFDAARSLDDVKQQIRLMGDVAGHPDRASAEIDRLDTAIAREADKHRRAAPGHRAVLPLGVTATPSLEGGTWIGARTRPSRMRVMMPPSLKMHTRPG